MNMHGLCRGIVTAINPDQPFSISQSTGYTTGNDGTRTPTYNVTQAMGQMQPLTSKDLRQVEGLNLNGTLRAIYFNGEVADVIRAFAKGGDLITDNVGNTWLVNSVLEQWDSWCKVVVTLQNGL